MDGMERQNARWTRGEGGEGGRGATTMTIDVPRDWIRTNPKPETGARRARVTGRGGVGRARVGRASARTFGRDGRASTGRTRAGDGRSRRDPGRADRGGIGWRSGARREKRRVAHGNRARGAGDARRDGGNVDGRVRTASAGSVGLLGITLNIHGSLGRGGLLSLGADDEALRAVGAGQERLAGDGLAADVRLDGHLRGRRLGRSLDRQTREGLGAGSHGRHRVDTSASRSERSSRCGARPRAGHP